MASLPIREQQLSTQTHAESSNAAEIRTQTETHEFLQFPDIRTHMKCQTLKSISVKTINSIDWNQMEKFDPNNRLLRLLPLDTPWRRFFDILEPSYDELVYEFWSTFYYTQKTDLIEETIGFRLGGRTVKLSLTQFALYLGIYTEEEVRSPIFTEALIKYPYNTQDYWHKHSLEEWSPNNDSKTFKDFLYQYMHRVISNTIRGRTSNPHRVSTTDLFHLYSIFESVPCNIAHGLASYFEYYDARRPKNLMGGSYITRLAKSLGVINDQIIQGLSPPKEPGFVSFSNIKLTHGHIPTQAFQFEITPIATNNTTPQNLQQLVMQFPRPSFYRHDLQPQQQLPPTFEHIQIDLSQTHHTQPQTPNIYQALSPLPLEQETMLQSLYNDELSFQELLASTLSPSNVEAGPSTVPLVDTSQDQMKITMTRMIKQNRKTLRHIE